MTTITITTEMIDAGVKVLEDALEFGPPYLWGLAKDVFVAMEIARQGSAGQDGEDRRLSKDAIENICEGGGGGGRGDEMFVFLRYPPKPPDTRK